MRESGSLTCVLRDGLDSVVLDLVAATQIDRPQTAQMSREIEHRSVRDLEARR